MIVVKPLTGPAITCKGSGFVCVQDQFATIEAVPHSISSIFVKTADHLTRVKLIATQRGQALCADQLDLFASDQLKMNNRKLDSL